MNAFHEVQFPTRIAYGASGGAEFNTSIVTTVAGFEQRNINWHKARGKWDISTGIKNKADIDMVIAFFRARFGKAYGFRFKDWSDYKGSSQIVSDGIHQNYQLTKTYHSGEHSYKRIIKKLVKDSVKIYFDDVLQQEGFAVDHTKGIIAFREPVEKNRVIKVDYEFDVPVRFDTDQINISLDGPNQYRWDAIPIIEIRL